MHGPANEPHLPAGPQRSGLVEARPVVRGKFAWEKGTLFSATDVEKGNTRRRMECQEPSVRMKAHTVGLLRTNRGGSFDCSHFLSAGDP